MARNVPVKTRKWHKMCHFFYSSFASMYNLKMKFRRASRCARVLMYGFSFSYSMMSLSRKSAVRLFATYCTGRGNLSSPFLSWILCLGISQRTERSAIVSSFGMSFGLVIRGRCMLFSSLHEISKIDNAHLHTDTCQAVFLWSPSRSEKATALAKGFILPKETNCNKIQKKPYRKNYFFLNSINGFMYNV